MNNEYSINNFFSFFLSLHRRFMDKIWENTEYLRKLFSIFGSLLEFKLLIIYSRSSMTQFCGIQLEKNIVISLLIEQKRITCSGKFRSSPISTNTSNV